jgi:hypothetical protein
VRFEVQRRRPWNHYYPDAKSGDSHHSRVSKQCRCTAGTEPSTLPPTHDIPWLEHGHIELLHEIHASISPEPQVALVCWRISIAMRSVKPCHTCQLAALVDPTACCKACRTSAVCRGRRTYQPRSLPRIMRGQLRPFVTPNLGFRHLAPMLEIKPTLDKARGKGPVADG